MNDTTTIDLLRHGQPVGGRRYRGQIDDPLSEQGWQEMWAAVRNPPPWEVIVSSPLARCHEFAQALGDKLSLAVERDERLREVGFGEWEGYTAAELEQRDPDILTRFYRNPVGNRPAGAEPLDAFSGRVNAAVTDVLDRHVGRHVLVVAHAGVIRATLTRVLDAPLGAMYRLSVATASMTRIRAEGQRPLTLVFHGRTPT